MPTIDAAAARRVCSRSIPFSADLLYEPHSTDGCAPACDLCAARPSPNSCAVFRPAP
jgi:hypothetical protein